MAIKASDPMPFGEFAPDVGDFGSAGSLLISNAIPYGDVYKPFADLSTLTDALPSKCLGGISFRDAVGNVTIFAATATKIYKLSGSSWVDVTRASGGDYTTGADGFWDFVNFGNLVIGTNYNDDIQCFEVGVDSAFSQMSSTAPRCRRLGIVDNFLVAVDTVDGDGAIGYRIRWSPLADPKGVWGSILATQTDFQDIAGGDYSNVFVAQIGDFGVVVQGRDIRRMDYIGGDTIFKIVPIDKGRGSILPRSCISNGKSVFFLGEDGYYEYNGADLIAIGNEKIDKYFYGLFDEANDFRLNTQIDPVRKLILWSFPSKAATAGQPDKIIAFNWTRRRWGIIDQECDCLFSYISVGLDMDSIDSLYPSVDAMPFSLDSRAYTGGKTSLGAFNSSHQLALFNGAAKTALIMTPETRINPSGTAMVASVIPYIEGTGVTITARLGTRNIMGDAVDWTVYVDKNSFTGEIDFLKDAVYHRAEFQIAGEWTTAYGMAYRAAPSGDF